VLVFAAESVFAESDVLPPEGWAHAGAAKAAISAHAIANNRKRKVVCIMFFEPTSLLGNFCW